MDINKIQIERFVKDFYIKVDKDDLLSPIFNDLASVNWIEHIPKLIKFWNSIMLKTGEYHGNAYQKHISISKKTYIDDLHFKRWLHLFEKQAHQHFNDLAAKDIILKATNIANSLRIGMLNNQK
jgi:hemoglobin